MTNSFGNNGTLTLDDPNAYPNPISNFVSGDTIDLSGVSVTSEKLLPGNTLVARIN